LAHEARDDVGSLARRKANDPAYRPRRIGLLRPPHARHGREHGSARREMQELSTPKFHDVPLRSSVRNGAEISVRTLMATTMVLANFPGLLPADGCSLLARGVRHVPLAVSDENLHHFTVWVKGGPRPLLVNLWATSCD
jgi:hypothetical protein